MLKRGGAVVGGSNPSVGRAVRGKVCFGEQEQEEKKRERQRAHFE